MGFFERQLASVTYTGQAGVYLPNALAVIRFGIHCYGVTAPGHGYLGTKVGVRLGHSFRSAFRSGWGSIMTLCRA